MEKIREYENKNLKNDIKNISPGDTVTVNYKVKEGERERLQPFRGTVVSLKGSSSKESITVRKISYGVGVERIFPLHSPLVESIKIEKKGKVRRSKLYYLRKRKGKATRIKEKRSSI